MCLAEALLRIPDRATADALIADKISEGRWDKHLGHSGSLFVNASTWGLLLVGPNFGAGGRHGWRASQHPETAGCPIGQARDPRGDAPGDAHSGRSICAGADDFAGLGASAGLGGQGLPDGLRHAWRGGPHGQGCRELFRQLRAGHRGDRSGDAAAARLRHRGPHGASERFGEAVRAASPVRAAAGRACPSDPGQTHAGIGARREGPRTVAH